MHQNFMFEESENLMTELYCRHSAFYNSAQLTNANAAKVKRRIRNFILQTLFRVEELATVDLQMQGFSFYTNAKKLQFLCVFFSLIHEMCHLSCKPVVI